MLGMPINPRMMIRSRCLLMVQMGTSFVNTLQVSLLGDGSEHL